jgi:hypothetical protein
MVSRLSPPDNSIGIVRFLRPISIAVPSETLEIATIGRTAWREFQSFQEKFVVQIRAFFGASCHCTSQSGRSTVVY